MNYDYYYTCNNSYIGMVVHHKYCRYLRNDKKKFLGTFYDYPHAVAIAKQRYPETDQCQACMELQRKTYTSVTTKPRNNHLSSGSKLRASKADMAASDSKIKGNGHVNRIPIKHSYYLSGSKRKEGE